MTRALIESVLLEKVYNTVLEKLESSQAPLAVTLLEGLFAGLSTTDLVRRNDSDLYGLSLSIWNALNSTAADATFIRVYNPELEKHGWQSSHTIVEIIVPDQPFLVDSIRMALNRLAIKAHLLLHNPVAVARDDSRITGIFPASDERYTHQAAFIIEIDRQSDQQAMQRIKSEFHGVLDEITLIVSDWQPMVKKLLEVRDELSTTGSRENALSLEEAVSYLEWLSQHNFTLMGYRYYALEAVAGDYLLQPKGEGSLGMFKLGLGKNPAYFSRMPPRARDIALGSEPLILNKSNYISRVHRPAYIDHVGVKVFDKEGHVVGEHRFIGLYASGIYNHSAIHIPMINAKVKRIMDMSSLSPGSHAYKALLNIIDTYPRDELIQASQEDLLRAGLGILRIQERDMLRLFVRADTYGRYYSCIIYTNKDRFNTALRVDTQSILKSYFNACGDVEFSTYFTEGVLARTQYIVRVDQIKSDLNVAELEQNLIEAARSWDDKLVDSLNSNYGEEQAKQLARKYQHAFPRSYKESLMPGAAVADLCQLEQLSDQKQLGMLFYRPQEEKGGSPVVKLKLFHLDQPLHLSDILPILENMGLRVIDESPYKIEASDGLCYWILDFSMTYGTDVQLDIELLRDNFQQALDAIWQGQLENDGFNRLVLGAAVTGREVALLRAYAKYLRQIGSNFSQQYMEGTLTRYPAIANLLLELFHRRFNPKRKRNLKSEEKLTEQIHLGLDGVNNLDDDRIIRHYLELIQATLRTNYYQSKGQKSYISLKFCAEMIAEMPAPKPKFEIFVYSPRVEGVHLRGGPVARGGLRWSDRREDFRTEILGLVKAQQVKNAVIVPVGAKGGFVCKQLPLSGERSKLLAEGKASYQIFIRGLLDITDNVLAGQVIPPEDVVRCDDDDPYLVVAADKGTATFSDIANGLSAEYNFWMGDAFASGGSNGYDHKAMGITARGAWESVKRHFREIGIDCQTQPFTCVGIGDMSGDVFGNGLLLSEQTQLVAAFNHMHIFIDPKPDSGLSFQERQRLFELQGSSWSDYNTQLISKGGGIFSRAAKSILLSDEIRQTFGITAKSLTPSELIRAILRSSVDLIWNGGIGTYVKSSGETDADVGDRANNAVRVTGQELKAKIFGEGGNLGCTQLGRIEFARSGGRINTDFIDNVGGVDCSDNEVNIKILLNQQVANGDLTEKQRNTLLVDMTDKVTDIVLSNAYRQSQSVSVTHHLGQTTAKETMRFMHALEREGVLDRALEFLPSDEEVLERLANGRGFSRPELSVLLAYAKMTLKQTLNVPEVTDDPFLSRELVRAFPSQLQERFGSQMIHHPLRHEIIATRLANRIVDDMGFNFVSRLVDETGTTSAEICTCYMITREVFELESLYQTIEGLDNQVDASIQLEMMVQICRLGRRATRRFLRMRDRNLSIAEQIKRYQPVHQQLKASLNEVMDTEDVNRMKLSIQQWSEAGVPQRLATDVVQLNTLYACMDIAEVCEQLGMETGQVSDLYFSLGSQVELHWFQQQIDAQPVDNHWQALARASFREDLDWQQRSLVQSALAWIMARDLDVEAGLQAWLEEHASLLDRWHTMMADFKTTSTHEFAKFSVLLRELNLLNLNCSNLA